MTMAALFKIGDRVQLVPPRAYISADEAFSTDPATGEQVQRGDVIAGPDNQGRYEVRTIDPDGELGAIPAGAVLIVGPNPKPGRQRRYVLSMDDDTELSTDENCLRAEV